jgi:hypothetical protein
MLIRKLTPSWPPAVTVGSGEPANLEDTVVGAQKQSEGHLVLMFHKGGRLSVRSSTSYTGRSFG